LNIDKVLVFKIIGTLGLLCIISGVLVKSRKKRNFIYIIGGIFLEIYSLYIGDLLFVILQAFFIIITIYDTMKLEDFTRDHKILAFLKKIIPD